MTLSDFKTLQSSKNWQHFIFTSENQRRGAFTPLSLTMDFDRLMVVPYDFPLLFFTAGERPAGQRYYPFSLTINGVVSIELGESSVLGDVLEVACRGGERYVIIAQ